MKSKLIKGTLFLTLATFISKIISFYYRIFLTNKIGTVGIGYFQMIMPVLAMFISIASGGIDIAIVRSMNLKKGFSYILKGSFVSSILLCLYLLIFSSTDVNCFISEYIIFIVLLIFVISLKTLLLGYLLGLGHEKIIALTTIADGFLKTFLLIIISFFFKTDSIQLPLISMLICEILLVLMLLIILKKNYYSYKEYIKKGDEKTINIALPIAFTKLFFSFIHTLEAELFPRLMLNIGYTYTDSVSLYGKISGIAIPIILFPLAIANAFSTMLLQSFSKLKKNEVSSYLKKSVFPICKICFSLGILCSFFFIFCGKYIAVWLFKIYDIGIYVSYFSLLCPFIFLSTSLNGIINGLGLTKFSFICNAVSGISRILLMIIFIPVFNVPGFCASVIIPEIIIAFMYVYKLKKMS